MKNNIDYIEVARKRPKHGVTIWMKLSLCVAHHPSSKMKDNILVFMDDGGRGTSEVIRYAKACSGITKVIRYAKALHQKVYNSFGSVQDTFTPLAHLHSSKIPEPIPQIDPKPVPSSLPILSPQRTRLTINKRPDKSVKEWAIRLADRSDK
ncbi:7414_t:CDS:2, partial [Dentiscutata erythropus]